MGIKTKVLKNNILSSYIKYHIVIVGFILILLLSSDYKFSTQVSARNTKLLILSREMEACRGL